MDESKGEIVTAGITLHEHYTSMLAAGFTPKQAIYLSAVMMGTATLEAPDGLDDGETP